MVKRRFTHSVSIDHIPMGHEHPIVVQSMTDTPTFCISETVEQIIHLAQAGAELVRLSVDSDQSAEAIPHIKNKLLQLHCKVPLVGDFHYNGHRLLEAHPDCAQTLSKYRINPGNVGFGEKKDKQFLKIIEIAKKYQKPIRIGVNWGSLDQFLLAKLMDENQKKTHPQTSEMVLEDALILSLLSSARLAEEHGLAVNQIVLSCKVSKPVMLIRIYQRIAEACSYPLHLGLTEAGVADKAIIATSGALSILLMQGIGDTIRASLTPEGSGDRTKEVLVCQHILQSLNCRVFTPELISCPGCGRTSSHAFQNLAQKTQAFLQQHAAHWRLAYPGSEYLVVAVMGCVVNGPGESRHAHIGISFPGNQEEKSAVVYIDGQKKHTLKKDIEPCFLNIISDYVQEKFKQ